MTFNEDVEPVNRYEACVKVTTKEKTAYYLGGGRGASDATPEEVVRKTFSALILFRWVKSQDDDKNKPFKRQFRGRNYQVVEVYCKWK